MITQAEVQALYDYRDGELYAKVRMGTREAGGMVGHIIPAGYKQTKIAGKRYYLHRLVWLYFNEELPEFLDHIDGNKSNNRIENLRPATHAQNMRNHPGYSESGYKGVSRTRDGNWRARINIDGKEKSLGVYGTAEAASLAYNKAASHFHGEFAYNNRTEGNKCS